MWLMWGSILDQQLVDQGKYDPHQQPCGWCEDLDNIIGDLVTRIQTNDQMGDVTRILNNDDVIEMSRIQNIHQVVKVSRI